MGRGDSIGWDWIGFFVIFRGKMLSFLTYFGDLQTTGLKVDYFKKKIVFIFLFFLKNALLDRFPKTLQIPTKMTTYAFSNTTFADSA